MNNSLAASVFLMRLKKLVDEDKLLFKPRNRQKTMQFLFDEGLSVLDVMVFFKEYKDIKLYIKLKIWKDENGDAGVVMSFHKEGQYD